MKSKYLIQGAILLLFLGCTPTDSKKEIADLILHNGNIAVMDSAYSFVNALAVKDGNILAVGDEEVINTYKGDSTLIIDAQGKTVIPGLNDSHLHLTRGGRFFNAELRWDGVTSLRKALDMLKEQAERTPKGQWVRVIGGWSPFQFEEKRFPTVEEINEATGDVPTFVLFLYSRGWLNKAGLKELQISAKTEAPEGTSYELGADGNPTGVLLAEPNPTLLYQTIGALPPLSEDEMINSTLHFYRELNRLGITSGIDAGGGGHQFPRDYKGTELLAVSGQMPLRLSYYLFPQKKGKEYQEFKDWMMEYEVGTNLDTHLDHGYELEGGGEFLTWSAGDFENFLAPQPFLSERENWREEFKKVVTLHTQKGWPFRIHATYGESIENLLEVIEEVNDSSEGKLARTGWLIDHAETVSESSLKRIKKLNGGIAIQARMAYAGEFFVERYGIEKAAAAPPIRKIMEAGIPIGAGTDGTRVASYNPWPALYWLVSGKTVGGLQLSTLENRLSRTEALRLYTKGSAWVSREETVKGSLEPGQYADFAILSDNYFNISEENIKDIQSLLTVVGGEVVYGTGVFNSLSPKLPEVIPSWSPVLFYGGYQNK